MRVGETQRGEIEAHEVMLFRLVTLLDAADVAGNQRALGNGDAGSAEGAIQPRRNWITHGGLVESDPCFQLQVQVNAGGELRLFGFRLRNGLRSEERRVGKE